MDVVSREKFHLEMLFPSVKEAAQQLYIRARFPPYETTLHVVRKL